MSEALSLALLSCNWRIYSVICGGCRAGVKDEMCLMDDINHWTEVDGSGKPILRTCLFTHSNFTARPFVYIAFPFPFQFRKLWELEGVMALGVQRLRLCWPRVRHLHFPITNIKPPGVG